MNHVEIASKGSSFPYGEAHAPVWIGLCGKMGVGKTATANALSRLLVDKGHGVAILPFARPLKLLARDYFGWDGQKDDRGRELLQKLGTDVGRWWDRDFWVKKWVQEADTLSAVSSVSVIADDVRFQNEVDMITSRPRSVVVRLLSSVRGAACGHASETQELTGPNVLFVNMDHKTPDEVACEILGRSLVCSG